MVYCFYKRGNLLKSWYNKYGWKGFSSSSSSCIKVIFFGTDTFSLGVLSALNEIRLNSGAITHLDVISSGKIRYIKKLKKHSIPAVINYAESHGLNTVSWEKVKEEKRFEIQYDLGVVASFGDFIPGKILSLITRGAINIHPSLLPRWRGPAPIIHTILAGDPITGISVIEVSKKRFDVGKILHQQQYEVPHLCTSDELLDYLSEKSGEMIPFIIDNLDELQRNAKTQCESLVTHAPKVGKSTGYIDFSKHSASYLQRLQRALPPKIGIRACLDGKEVKFGQIKNVTCNTSPHDEIPIGGCWYDKRNRLIFIKVLDGHLSVSNLKFEYKTEISAASFYNGYMVDKATGFPGQTYFKSIT